MRIKEETGLKRMVMTDEFREDFDHYMGEGFDHYLKGLDQGRNDVAEGNSWDAEEHDEEDEGFVGDEGGENKNVIIVGQDEENGNDQGGANTRGEYSIKVEENCAEAQRLLRDNDSDDDDISKIVLFCSICSISFDKKDEYGRHLNTHCVELQNAARGNTELLSGDHGYTCTTCHVKYVTKGRFIRHMSVAPHNSSQYDWLYKQQNSSSAKSKNRRVNPYFSSRYYCPPCDGMTFDTKEDHHNHLRENHYREVIHLKYLKSKVENRTLASMNGFYARCPLRYTAYSEFDYLNEKHRKEKHPDSEEFTISNRGKRIDNYWHCRNCGIPYRRDEKSHKKHRKLHRSEKHMYAVTHLEDLDDFEFPAFYCGECGRAWDNYLNFRYHLTKIHDVQRLMPCRTRTDPDIMPDIDDPHFYCKSCDFKFAGQPQFRRHLKTFRKMLLPSLRQKSKNTSSAATS